MKQKDIKQTNLLKFLHLLAAILILALACAPREKLTEQPTEPKPSEAAVSVKEERVERVEEARPGPISQKKLEAEPYSQLECEQLVSVKEFAAACDTRKITQTTKIGTKNCYLSFSSPEFERRTAGIVLTAYESSQEAQKEFERRAGMRKAEILQTVGQGVYKFTEIERANFEFVKDRYIVVVSADKALCSEKGLLELAKIVSGKLG